jgi:hypothetical protein
MRLIGLAVVLTIGFLAAPLLGEAQPAQKILGGHFKTGQTWTAQNRP